MDNPLIDTSIQMSCKSLHSFSIPGAYEGYLTDVYVSEGELHSRVERLAMDIVNYYKT